MTYDHALHPFKYFRHLIILKNKKALENHQMPRTSQGNDESTNFS